MKAREKRQKAISTQLSMSLSKPKLWSFINKNRASRKMTSIEAAVVAKADKL